MYIKSLRNEIRHLSLNGCLIFYRVNRGVYFEGKLLVLLHSQITYMYKKRTKHAQLEISIKVEYHRIVKVKAHTRFCNGKKVKVKAHYRRY